MESAVIHAQAVPPLDDQGPKGGWWATPEETARFLNLKDKEGNWNVQKVYDLANRNLSRRRCAGIFREADVQRLGGREFRVWCCKPNNAGQRRPEIHDREVG